MLLLDKQGYDPCDNVCYNKFSLAAAEFYRVNSVITNLRCIYPPLIVLNVTRIAAFVFQCCVAIIFKYLFSKKMFDKVNDFL